MQNKKNKQMKQNIKLTIVLMCITVFSVRVSAQTTWQSNLVQINTLTGELSYTQDPTSGIRIPDFSRAGYKGGGVPLPIVPVKSTVSPISGDNTVHIQNAIDYVSSLPLDSNGFRGAVLLNSGYYFVYGTLKITTSGVILRGSGRDNTRILGLGNTPANRDIIKMGGLSETQFAGKVPGTKTNIISPIVKVGDKKFRVDDASLFQVGDNIIIKHPCTQKWLDAIDGGGTADEPKWTEGSLPIIFNTRIEKIKCDTIYTNSPVFNTLNSSLSQSFIYKYDRAGLIENVGIEDLLIDIEFSVNDPSDDNHAKTAVLVSQVENAWVKGCEFLHFWHSGVRLQTANYVTVKDCNAYKPKGPTTGGYKYNFTAGKATQNSLFTNCKASKGRHAYVSNGTSSVAGVVFHKCTSVDPHTSSEGHRRWSTGLLYDNLIDSGSNPGKVLVLQNRGSYGTSHGWAAANSVLWNCDASRSGTDGKIVVQRPPTAQNFAIGCKGDVSGNGPFSHPAGYIEGSNRTDLLLPNSLYDAQLNSRNYLESIDTALLTDIQSACDLYTWIDGITYDSSTNVPEFTLTDINGCDSIVKLDLTINAIDNIVTQSGTSLTANLSGAAYQWLDCNNGFSNILGETNQSYSATASGNYAVKISQNGCEDTSACFSINTLGIIDSDFRENVIVYPNPTNGKVMIDLGTTYSALDIKVYNSNGQVVLVDKFNKSEMIEIDIHGKSDGFYFIKITTLENKKATIKIVKQ